MAISTGWQTSKWVAVFGLLVSLVIVPDALAQRSSADSLRALEEEINLLKETVETSHNQVRKLNERIGELEAGSTARGEAIQQLRRRLLEIESLRKQMSELEAKVLTKKAENDKSGEKVRLIADIRVRPQMSINRTDLNSDQDDDDAYWGHRARLGLRAGIDSWVRGHIEVQEQRRLGDTHDGEGDVGIHQAWVEIEPASMPGVWARVGRMEWSFGSERLIGRDDFSVTGQAFDGALIRWGHLPWIDVQAFYAKVRESNRFDGDGDFFGVYTKSRAIPYTQLELYFMGLFDEQIVTGGDGENNTELSYKDRIYTVGGRAEALLFDSLHLEGEAVFQFGSRTDPSDPNRELSHFATAYFAEVSYQAPIATRPTIGGFFAWASGDANPTDGKSLDFQTLFPTRHNFLGTMDLFDWANLIDIGGTFGLTPPGDLGFSATFHYFMLAQPRGQLFGLGTSGVPNKDVGRTVGMEVDATLSWAPTDTFLLQAGYSLFLPGSVTDELGIGTDLAHWAYTQVRFEY